MALTVQTEFIGWLFSLHFSKKYFIVGFIIGLKRVWSIYSKTSHSKNGVCHIMFHIIVFKTVQFTKIMIRWRCTDSISSSGPVVYVLDLADRLISKAGPFAAAGIMVGSIYWTAVTYGAVTVMQVQVIFFLRGLVPK